MVKLTIKQEEELYNDVIEFLSNLEEDQVYFESAVLQELYEKRYNNKWNDLSEEDRNSQITAIEALIKMGKATKDQEAMLDMLKNGCSFKEREVQFSLAQVGAFFNKRAENEAAFRKINRELTNLVKKQRIAFNDTKINNALATIGDCYGISDKELKPILALLSQIKLRLKVFSEVGDIRKVTGYKGDHGIMPAFWGNQGCGKSEFANLISEVVSGKTCAHSIDTVLGKWGTLDAFYKPLILMNEFGRQKKDNLDLLKSYVNGEVVEVDRKNKDPVVANAFASFIITSNFDPEMLKGTELGSRRICVVNFNNNKPTKSIEEVKQAIQDIWDNCDETTFDKFFHTTKEDLAMSNLEEQTETEIEEFLATITDDDKDWLVATPNLTKRNITKRLCENYGVPATYVHMLLKEQKLFDVKQYSKVKFYSLKV